MIDIKLIRENPELVKNNCKKRVCKIDVDSAIKVDKEWRQIKLKDDSLRAERNKLSKKINEAKKLGEDASKLIQNAKEIPKKLSELEIKEKELRNEREYLLAMLPNLFAKDVPVGGEDKNKVLKKFGKIKKFKFKAKPHWEIGENLGLLDLGRAAKLAGSGFCILRGELAILQRALIQFMLDFHIKNGFEEINCPQIVKSEIVFGTGQLPRFEQDLYKTSGGMYLVPTAEVSVTNLYAGEILNEKDLPKKFCSFTQCYRQEAGKHGAETRGIFRLHQFEKVEMVYVCREEDSWKFLEEMTRHAEKILEKLKIPYQRVILSTGDSGFAAAKTYDLKVWSPYQKKYLEVSSCSNCTDFQARRMNTRYQSKDGKLKLVHTLNGSGLALPRLLIAILENYQQKDGSIKIPSCLWKYTGFKVIKAKLKANLKPKNNGRKQFE